MAYTGPRAPTAGKNIGIKPTEDDRKYVHTLSAMNVSVRQICVILGEHYKLGKPMSRQTLYWHFKKNLIRKGRGRHAKTATIRRRWEENLTSGMQAMIDEIKARNKAKRKSA